ILARAPGLERSALTLKNLKRRSFQTAPMNGSATIGGGHVAEGHAARFLGAERLQKVADLKNAASFRRRRSSTGFRSMRSESIARPGQREVVDSLASQIGSSVDHCVAFDPA